MNTIYHIPTNTPALLSEADLEGVHGGGLSLTNYLAAAGAVVGGAAVMTAGLLLTPVTFGGSLAVGMTAGGALIGAGVGGLTGTGIEAVKDLLS